jgi:hypothetical protein
MKVQLKKTKKKGKTLDNTEIYANFAGKLDECRFNAKINISSFTSSVNILTKNL